MNHTASINPNPFAMKTFPKQRKMQVTTGRHSPSGKVQTFDAWATTPEGAAGDDVFHAPTGTLASIIVNDEGTIHAFDFEGRDGHTPVLPNDGNPV